MKLTFITTPGLGAEKLKDLFRSLSGLWGDFLEFACQRAPERCETGRGSLGGRWRTECGGSTRGKKMHGKVSSSRSLSSMQSVVCENSV